MQHQQQDRSHTHEAEHTHAHRQQDQPREAEHAHQHQQQDHTQQDRSRTQKQPGGAQPHRTKQPRPSNAPLGTGMGDGMCQSDCSLAAWRARAARGARPGGTATRAWGHVCPISPQCTPKIGPGLCWGAGGHSMSMPRWQCDSHTFQPSRRLPPLSAHRTHLTDVPQLIAGLEDVNPLGDAHRAPRARAARAQPPRGAAARCEGCRGAARGARRAGSHGARQQPTSPSTGRFGSTGELVG